MKKYLKPKNVLLFVFAIMLIGIFSVFFHVLSFPDSEKTLQKGEPVKVKKEETLVQKFTANRNNLTKIAFLLRESNLKKNNVISATLLDESCSKEIRKGLIKNSFLSDDNLYEFAFPLIKNSLGKTFCIELTPKPKTIQLFTTSGVSDYSSVENKTTNEKFPGQSLSMRPAYKNDNVWQDARELSDRLSQYKPWFLKNYFLSLVAVLFIVMSAALVAILIVI